MTDINELAQSLKAAAEKATPGQWERGDGKHGGELLVYCDDALGSAVCEATSEYNAIPKYQRIDNLDFIAMANPANILSLVEALEYYKSREERVTSLVRDNSKSWDELYRQVEAKGKRNVELVEALEKAQRYIEELREWNADLAQESFERQQLISELEPIRAAAEKLVRCKGRYHSEQNYRALAALFGVKTPDLPPLEHENVHYADAAEMEIAALRQRIAELESRTVTVKMPEPFKLAKSSSGLTYYYADEVNEALSAAGIKREGE